MGSVNKKTNKAIYILTLIKKDRHLIYLLKHLKDMAIKCNLENCELAIMELQQQEKRFFMIARCDGQKIVFPEPTHGDPEGIEVRCGLLKPWRTAAECIDWSIPIQSIFERKKPLAEKNA